ncbi:hypothetical protein LY76DRAFT_78976 [Colletotrichum caudatum]|nr:hypothetical protein LY76DRAFT_78976 [Colletotrichum caudatum]
MITPPAPRTTYARTRLAAGNRRETRFAFKAYSAPNSRPLAAAVILGPNRCCCWSGQWQCSMPRPRYSLISRKRELTGKRNRIRVSELTTQKLCQLPSSVWHCQMLSHLTRYGAICMFFVLLTTYLYACWWISLSVAG